MGHVQAGSHDAGKLRIDGIVSLLLRYLLHYCTEQYQVPIIMHAPSLIVLMGFVHLSDSFFFPYLGCLLSSATSAFC